MADYTLKYIPWHKNGVTWKTIIIQNKEYSTVTQRQVECCIHGCPMINNNLYTDYNWDGSEQCLCSCHCLQYYGLYTL